MRGWMTAPTAAAIGVLIAAPAAPAAADRPALVERTEWVRFDGLPSLRVYPTPSGRAAAARLGAGAQGERAWVEVLASAPDADTAGMREQFLCHWRFAELAHPGKTSWNLEPWRPVVDTVAMLDADCNPGGPEEGY